MNFPKLSVVIPNYNHAAYLPHCLQAVLRQSAQAMEIIVLDDASTDDSVKVIESIARQHPLIPDLTPELLANCERCERP